MPLLSFSYELSGVNYKYSKSQNTIQYKIQNSNIKSNTQIRFWEKIIDYFIN